MKGFTHRGRGWFVVLAAAAVATTAARWAPGGVGWRAGPAASGAVTAAAGSAAAADEPAGPPPPDGLVVARSRGVTADVVAAVGGEWQTIVPASALAPAPDADRRRSADVVFVAVSPGLSRAALTVLHCAPEGAEPADCRPRSYVYDRMSGHLEAPGDEAVPVGWLADGRLLVDAVSGGARVFDPATGATGPVAGADADYTVGFGAGLAPGGGRIAYSTGAGEKVLDLATGTTVALAGIGSADRTPWLAFSPDGTRVAVARRLAVDVDDAAFDGLPWPSEIAVHDAVSGRRLAVVAPGDAPGGGRDLAPRWARGGRELVFLRADRAGQGVDLFEPARVMRHDLATAVTTAVVDDVASRRDVVVPPTGDVAVWLEQSGTGAPRAMAVDLTTGRRGAVLPDDAAHRHTALAWADPQAGDTPAATAARER
ncbi:hypothetical protein DCC79_08695 [bacterium]|nr:MAG: hypothetical protein DCC79_08695 [bacterium]